MNDRTIFALFWVLVSLLANVGCSRQLPIDPPSTAVSEPATAPTAISSASDEEFDGVKVVRSDEEWRTVLTGDQFYVLREEGTEPSFSGEYDKFYQDGDYYCAACHLKLFSSKHKFDSGTGWPSFYRPINPKNVTEKPDTAFGVTQTEVECSRCGSHLGHVFDDGPKPTGLRYCMNSVALKFERSGQKDKITN